MAGDMCGHPSKGWLSSKWWCAMRVQCARHTELAIMVYYQLKVHTIQVLCCTGKDWSYS